MEIIIRPVDIWFFRDGRPFTAGEDHDAETTFPPTPFTLQGAIRTRVLADKGVDLTRFAVQRQSDPDVGFGNDFGRLHLSGPMVVRQRNGGWERLVPMPADVVRGGNGFLLLKPKGNPPFKTNLPEGLRLLWIKELAREEKRWLPESEWMRYLQGNAPEQGVQDEELFVLEPRFGIAIDRSKRVVQTQMLYRAVFIRLKEGVALWAHVEGIAPKEKQGFLQLGGERRGATYEALDSPLPATADFRTSPNKRFKVVLLSPAWFSSGWQPRDGWQVIFGVPVHLVGAAIPRPQKFGGFDIARKRPKPIRSFVPAGSVYFFEAKDDLPTFCGGFAFTETPEDVRKENNGKNAWAQIGLGKVLIGNWD